MKYDVLIRGCAVLNENFEVDWDQDIAIAGGVIAAVGPNPLPGEAEQEVDGRGKLFLPGLVDGHIHTCQQLLRGRILDQLPMIWTRIMLPFESGLTEEAVEAGAELACLELIKSGTTAFADAGGRHMDAVARVVERSGLRAALTCSTIDAGDAPATMKHSTQACLEQNDSLFDRWHGAGEGRISVFYSLRSMLSCTEELTLRVFERAGARGTGVHAHISEYPNEVNASLERHRLRPVEYLDKLGVLGPNFLAAHSILLNDDEIDLMAERGVKVVHCPFSNCGKGVPYTPRLLQRGASVGLGTDGAAHGGLSLWNEMKIFRSVMNAHVGVPYANPVVMPARTILRMATCGGGAALGYEGRLGAVKAGYLADLISISLDQPHILPTSDLPNTLLETVNAGDVADSMVQGRFLMRDRKVLVMDEKAVLDRARELHHKCFPEG